MGRARSRLLSVAYGLSLLLGPLATGSLAAAFADDPEPASAPRLRGTGDESPKARAGEVVDAERLFERVVVIGASASAGFNTQRELGKTVTLARVLDVLIRGRHGEITSAATPLFFLQPIRAGSQSIGIAEKRRPTLLVAVDFLFWYAYGRKTDEADRLRDIDTALALLAKFDCPVLISTIPDMSDAIGKMLSRSQVPRPETLGEINRRIETWAAERKNVALVPLVRFAEDVRANRAFRVRNTAYAAGETARLLQWDRLHPTGEGLAALGVLTIDTLLQQVEGLAPERFDLDAESVYRKVRARLVDAESPEEAGAEPAPAGRAAG